MPVGVGTVVVVVGLGWLVSMMFGASGGPVSPADPSSPGGTGGGGSGGGGGGGGSDTPGVPKIPKAPSSGDTVPDDVPRNPMSLLAGGVWGDASKIPDDFAWDGNGWYVAGDCSAVAVGRGFAPENFTIASSAKRQSITTLQSVTQIVPGPTSATGTLWNFLFHLGFDLGLLPDEMIRRTKAGLSLFCSEVDQWPAGFAELLESEIDTFYLDQIEGVE